MTPWSPAITPIRSYLGLPILVCQHDPELQCPKGYNSDRSYAVRQLRGRAVTCCANGGGYGDHRRRGEYDYIGGYRALSPARERFSFRMRGRHHRPEPPRVSPPSQACTRYCACVLARLREADRQGNRESG